MNRIRTLLLAAGLSVAFSSPMSAKAAEGAANAGPSYVRLRPISFSVIGATNKVDKEVSIMLALELEPGKDETAFDQFRRKVLDAFLITLNEIYEDRKSDDSPIAGEVLKDRLLEVANDVTGPGLIHSVLIMSLGERAHSR
jgi:nucleoside-specific outer membrane channel protein Tsx